MEKTKKGPIEKRRRKKRDTRPVRDRLRKHK